MLAASTGHYAALNPAPSPPHARMEGAAQEGARLSASPRTDSRASAHAQSAAQTVRIQHLLTPSADVDSAQTTPMLADSTIGGREEGAVHDRGGIQQSRASQQQPREGSPLHTSSSNNAVSVNRFGATSSAAGSGSAGTATATAGISSFDEPYPRSVTGEDQFLNFFSHLRSPSPLGMLGTSSQLATASFMQDREGSSPLGSLSKLSSRLAHGPALPSSMAEGLMATSGMLDVAARASPSDVHALFQSSHAPQRSNDSPVTDRSASAGQPRAGGQTDAQERMAVIAAATSPLPYGVGAGGVSDQQQMTRSQLTDLLAAQLQQRGGISQQRLAAMSPHSRNLMNTLFDSPHPTKRFDGNGAPQQAFFPGPPPPPLHPYTCQGALFSPRNSSSNTSMHSSQVTPNSIGPSAMDRDDAATTPAFLSPVTVALPASSFTANSSGGSGMNRRVSLDEPVQATTLTAAGAPSQHAMPAIPMSPRHQPPTPTSRARGSGPLQALSVPSPRSAASLDARSMRLPSTLAASAAVPFTVPPSVAPTLRARVLQPPAEEAPASLTPSASPSATLRRFPFHSPTVAARILRSLRPQPSTRTLLDSIDTTPLGGQLGSDLLGGQQGALFESAVSALLPRQTSSLSRQASYGLPSGLSAMVADAGYSLPNLYSQQSHQQQQMQQQQQVQQRDSSSPLFNLSSNSSSQQAQQLASLFPNISPSVLPSLLQSLNDVVSASNAAAPSGVEPMDYIRSFGALQANQVPAQATVIDPTSRAFGSSAVAPAQAIALPVYGSVRHQPAAGSNSLPAPYSDKWRKYKCSFCGKGFCNRSGVERHERTHTGEAPFPCLLCGKRFKQKGTLKDHERIHSGEKAFDCPYQTQCGKKFRHRSSLHRHMDKCPAAKAIAAGQIPPPLVSASAVAGSGGLVGHGIGLGGVAPMQSTS